MISPCSVFKIHRCTEIVLAQTKPISFGLKSHFQFNENLIESCVQAMPGLDFVYVVGPDKAVVWPLAGCRN